MNVVSFAVQSYEIYCTSQYYGRKKMRLICRIAENDVYLYIVENDKRLKYSRVL